MIDGGLSKDFFKGNREKLFKSLSVDILIVTANGILQKSADQTFSFSQDSNFFYLTGIYEADIIMVKSKTGEYVIVPEMYVHRQSAVDELDKDYITKVSGIDEILTEKEGWNKFKSLVKDSSSIATLLPSPTLLKFYGMYTNPARRQLVNKIKRLYPRAKLIDIRKEMAGMRMVKQRAEIDILQKATNITTQTLAEVLNKNKMGQYKDTGEIAKAILDSFIAKGASGHAFDPIVAAGRNAAFFHYDKLNQPLKNGQLIVVDVGCEYSFYSADFTRTVSYGQPSKRAVQVFEAVKRVQLEAFKLIKPGMNFRLYERKVEKLIGEELKKLGVINRLNRKAIRQYYPHACTHSLGLDAHDSADYSLPAAENMILMVEPGIYLKDEAIGARLEDVVRVTKDGYRLMSHLPTNLKL